MQLGLANEELQRLPSGFKFVTTNINGIEPGEMIVRLLAVGICGTDKQMIRQERADSAAVIGHEGVGSILLAGAGVSGFSAGQLVVFNPVNPHDQDLVLGHSTSGLLQTYRVISEAEISHGLVLQVDLPCATELGILAEPLGAAIYAHELIAKYTNVEKLAIVGGGPEGLLSALYALGNLGREVFLVHNESSRLDWIAGQEILHREKMFLDSDRLASEILAATRGRGVDATIVCTSRRGSLAALSKALLYTRNEGCINLTVGFDSNDRLGELPDVDLGAIRRRNVCGHPVEGFASRHRVSGRNLYLTGHRGTSRTHILQAIETLTANPKSYSRLITHRIPFSGAAQFLEFLAKSRHPCCYEQRQIIKPVIDFSDTTRHYDREKVTTAFPVQ